jgi:hypothetical protein
VEPSEPAVVKIRKVMPSPISQYGCASRLPGAGRRLRAAWRNSQTAVAADEDDGNWITVIL